MARLKSTLSVLHGVGEASGLQVCSVDATYAWNEIDSGENSALATLFPAVAYESIGNQEMHARIGEYLDASAPDIIAIAGWGSVDARACLDWARRHDCRTILMSETRQVDGKRVWYKEWLKSRIVRQFDAALVGSRSHADYLVQLGMKPEQIFRGYNVVDNDYFQSRTEAIRQTLFSPIAGERTFEQGLDWESTVNRTPFFLASNRFVQIKNLSATIEAFNQYRESGGTWDLCLLGEGPLKDFVVSDAQRYGMKVSAVAPWEDKSRTPQESTVYFPGFRQIDALPEFYARAGAFLHPAISEPWGLVINEAMASGLPILASQNGGAAEELVDVDVNGFVFDPCSITDISQAMLRLSQLDASRRLEMGTASLRIVNERVPTRAFGEGIASALCFMGSSV